ncbi:MAG: hypothetical protein ABFD07_19040 [Methanobacterium sp.]
MKIENNKELLREFINKYPNNFNLGIELRKIMPNNEMVKKYPNDMKLGEEFRKKIQNLD